MPCLADSIVQLYSRFKDLTSESQKLEAERNQLSKTVHPTLENRETVKNFKKRLSVLHDQLRLTESHLIDAGLSLPNTSHQASPIGGPDQNAEICKFGPAIAAGKTVVDHLALGKSLDILDFEVGAKVAGSQQYFLKNQGALLEIALMQYAIKTCLASGFKLMLPPDMAYTSFVRACGFNPRNADAALPIYTVHQEEKDENAVMASKRALVGTAEVPLAAYYSDRILDLQQLPIKIVGFGHCFRPEIGHHGSESRGLYRVHQFSKVEMFAITESSLESSERMFDEIVEVQKKILGELGVACRVLNMATEELGASAHYKYDMEAWFPAGQRWGELTSASNCTDFQSRRLAIRYRAGPGKPNLFPHSLNGTACAIPRVIQAILENHQSPCGTFIDIPPVLHPFMLDGSKRITK